MGVPDEVKSVLVSGGGIGGLSAAIALSQLGLRVTVAEKSAGREDGAGITIQNRGLAVLKSLGVLDECMSRGYVKETGSLFDNFFDSAGNHRPSVPKNASASAPDTGMPALVMLYRPRLAEILTRRATELGALVRTEAEVTDVNDLGDRVEVTFAGDERESFDLVVGADGTNSRIRKKLFGNRIVSTYSGNMSLRWVKRDGPQGQVGFYVGEASEPVVVHYPEEGLVYVASGIDMENRPVSREEAVQLFRKVLRTFPAPFVQELADSVEDDDEVIARPYMLHNLPAPWHRGRIVLLGDAVHTMSAHLASGGVIALEDAQVLAEELAAGGSLEESLERYGKRRSIRTFFAVDACRRMLDLQVNYHAGPAVLSPIRQEALAALSQPF